MRAASHWTWLAVLAALSPKARFADHDVPESGAMLFAELLHCVCVVCGLHCFGLLGFRFKCLFLVNQTELRQKSGEREREVGGDFKHLVPMGSSEKARQNLGKVYKG